METGVIVAIAFATAFALLIFIRVMAGQKHLFGRICRWFWNTSFKVSSYIPFMGWMAHFMIADTPEEKETKQRYISIGFEVDSTACEIWDSFEREKRIREEKEKRVREKLLQNGYSNVSVDVSTNTAYCNDINGNSYQFSVTWTED